MLIKKIQQVPAKPVQMEGAENVSVRVIFGPDDGAATFAMRVFELLAAGHTPYHTHPFEHEVLILSGQISLTTEQGPVALAPGDAVLVGANEKHQFKNLSAAQPASFLCLVPVEYQK